MRFDNFEDYRRWVDGIMAGPGVPPYKQPENFQTDGFDERPKVHAWRLEQLLLAGCSNGDAERLADSNADLHIALRMLSQGCHPHLVVEILT